MSEATDQNNLLISFGAVCILAASLIVILPLLLYTWLWVSALGIDHRLNPALDRYGATWGLVALGCAAYNSWHSWRLIKNPSAQQLAIMLVISAALIVGCPEFYY